MRNLLSVGLVIGLGMVVGGCGRPSTHHKSLTGASTASTTSSELSGGTWLGQGPSHLTPLDPYGVDGGSIDGGSIDGGSNGDGSIDGGSIDGGSIDGGSIDGGSIDGGSNGTTDSTGGTTEEPSIPTLVTGEVPPTVEAATLGARPVASLNVARGGHSALRLRSGDVLVVGGLGAPKTPLGAPELYEPAMDRFVPLGPIPGVAAGDEWKAALPTLTLLQNDDVLVTGGYGLETAKDKSPQKLKSAYLYSAAARTFTKVQSMKFARVGHAAALLPNGDVLVTGGGSVEIEVYTPSMNAWTQVKADAKRTPIGASVTVAGDRLVLAGGGGTSIDGGSAGDGVKVTQSILLGAPFTATKLSDLATGRTNHGAAVLDDQHVVVVGGHDPPNPKKVLASIEVLDLASGAWTVAGDLHVARTGCELARVHGALAVFGGSTGTTEAGTVELLAASGARDGREFELVRARNTFTATELLDGRVLLAGGFVGSESPKDLEDLKGTALAACEAFGLGVGPSGPSAAPAVLVAGPGGDGTTTVTTTTPSDAPAAPTGPAIRAGDLFDAASQLVGTAVLLEGKVVGAAADLDRTTGGSKKQARISYTFVKDGQVLATKRDATNQLSNAKGAVGDFNAAYGLTGTNGFSLTEGEYPAAVEKAYPDPKGKAKRSYAGLVIVVRVEDFADETVSLELTRITR